MSTEAAPSASGVVYLFGDRFAKKARVGGEKLVYGEAKVKLSDLVDNMVLAAFVELASEGYLGLEPIEEKRLGLFTTRDIGLTRLSEPGHPLYGLERAVWENISGDPKQDRVREIISKITGGTRPSPWSVILEKAKEGLGEQGYLIAEKEVRRFLPDTIRWLANEESIVAHEGRVAEVEAMLGALETRDPTLYKQLVDSVKKGIKAMVESTDYDFD